MKKSLPYIAAASLLVGALLGSCIDTEYTYDVESGLDENHSESSNVTVDTLQGIDASMYEQARIFPGLVDTLTEVRTDTAIVLDLSKPYISKNTAGFYTGNIETTPQPIYSTGLYAGAGELVTIRVPEEGNTWGLSVQVGMQTDNLGEGNSYFRQPVVFTRKALFPGTNRVRFPLGGYLWIIREQAMTGPAECRLEFDNVYSAPDFIVDATDPEAWSRKLASTTVPWLDLRGHHVAISIDRAYLNEYVQADPEFAGHMNELLHAWDSYMEYFYALTGHTPGNETVTHCMPYFPQRFIFDAQLKDNAILHNDNQQGIMMVKTSSFYEEILNLLTVESGYSENLYRAMQDRLTVQYAPYPTSWNSALNLIPIYRLAEQNGYLPIRTDMAVNIPTALQYAAADSAKSEADSWVGDYQDGANYNSDFLRLTPLVQISQMGTSLGEEEWAFQTAVAQQARTNRQYVWDESYSFRALCDHYRLNFTPFYDQWGIALTDADREYATRYELTDREYWKIDPLNQKDAFAHVGTYNKARFRYRHNRSQWEIWATEKGYRQTNEDTEYDNESSYNTASLLLDGDLFTYWRSYLAKADKDQQQDAPYELPYYLVIDMKEAQNLHGFYFGNGKSTYLSGFTVQYTTNTDISLDDETVQWTDLKHVTQTTQDALYNVRFYDLDAPVQARYLRIVIADPNLLAPNPELEGDVEAFEKYHKNRRQAFSEFGTYYYK